MTVEISTWTLNRYAPVLMMGKFICYSIIFTRIIDFQYRVPVFISMQNKWSKSYSAIVKFMVYVIIDLVCLFEAWKDVRKITDMKLMFLLHKFSSIIYSHSKTSSAFDYWIEKFLILAIKFSIIQSFMGPHPVETCDVLLF